mgnify:CR=1 FL=1
MPLNKLRPKSLNDSSVSSISESTYADDPVDTDDLDENDESGQNILLNIISQLKPGCDLSRITLPTFILEKKSMLERITNIESSSWGTFYLLLGFAKQAASILHLGTNQSSSSRIGVFLYDTRIQYKG